MKFHLKSVGTLVVSIVAFLAFQHIGQTQSPTPTATPTSGQSDYIFRFNTGISGVFLDNITFPNQQSINLGSCTATEKINGPLICAVNCSNQSVCLLDLVGPSGSTVNDVLELVSETPATTSATSSPSPTASVIPGLTFANPVFRASADLSASLERRINAYNQVR
jgi:hypothetical protein